MLSFVRPVLLALLPGVVDAGLTARCISDGEIDAFITPGNSTQQRPGIAL